MRAVSGQRDDKPNERIGEPGPDRDDRCACKNDQACRPYSSHEAAVTVSISTLEWSPGRDTPGCDRAQPRGIRGLTAQALIDQRSDGLFEIGADRVGDIHRPWMGPAAAGVGDNAFAMLMRKPSLHRGPFVRRRERCQNGIANLDISQITLHNLLLMTLRPATEIAPHRIDDLTVMTREQRRRTPSILLRKRRPGEIDTQHPPTISPDVA